MSHEYYMRLALDQAKLALAKGEFPVGCVIECNGKILSTGSRINTLKDNANEIDHAEIIALKKLSKKGTQAPSGTISLYSTMEPCLMCFAAIILSNISQIVYAYEDVMGGGTNCDLTQLTPLYKESKIVIVPNILREESLALFKIFFQNAGNEYWKESLLAKYTLAQ